MRDLKSFALSVHPEESILTKFSTIALSYRLEVKMILKPRTPLLLWVLFFSFVLGGIAAAQTGGEPASPEALLPTDPAVRVGKLPNGITYYVRQNNRPEDRAELRLAIQAGSILEDEDQLGFAHFVEHMAFNGTEHFARNELIEFLESLGMRFGADLNAFTGYDQTVYMLQVPTDDEESLSKGFLILKDWASTIKFEGKEIDDERRVVIEEWRARRSGDSKVNDEHFKVIYGGSRYADRQPIGKKEVLESGSHHAMRKFYKDWYRPDLMAIVAVGDFDPEAVEEMIQNEFSSLPAVANPRPRPQFDIPVHEGTHYSIAFDPEASNPAVQFIVKHERARRDRHMDYRRSLVEQIVSGMLSQRLDELRRQADPPFVFAIGHAGLGLGLHRQFYVTSRVKDGEYLRGLEAVLTEAERVRRYGFTSSELVRMKSSMLAGIEQYYAEKDKTESGSYAREYYSNHTSEESFPGIEYEYQMYQWYVPSLTLEEVNHFAEELLKENGRVLTISGPEREGMKKPTVADIESIVKKVMESDVKPYAEEEIATSLMEKKPRSGSLVSEKNISEIGVTEWKLSNGARVVLKPTDFKDDEIFMTAYSPGGTSVVSNADYIPASTSSALMSEGGVGSFDRTSLNKFLTGKVASASVGLSDLYEIANGRSSNKDIETMFQLLYLSFVAPRKHETALLSYRSMLQGLLETKGTRPEQVFNDTVSYVSAGYNYRARPWTLEMLDELNLDKSYSIFRDRFADAGDFTFFFVGSFDPQKIKPLVETYIASLPSIKRDETWRDVGVRTPKGEITKIVRKGVDQKGKVHIIYTGDFDWSMVNRHKFQSMVEILRMKLRETLREEKGGVYSPGAVGRYKQFPIKTYELHIVFGCDPDRVDELISDVESIVKSLQEEKVDQTYIEKVQEIQRRERETSLKENNFWLNSLQFYYQQGEDPTNILKYGNLYKTLTPELIQEQAQEYFGSNRITFILVPEEG